MQPAILAMEDGRCFHGAAFGAAATAVGEAVFNTSMTGYQEVLTDPSYRGQIVAMTYPLIGNYGVNALDPESDRPHVRGFVIEELSPVASSWRAEGGLDDYLRASGIPGIQGVDTRALTRHLRERGAMKACLAVGATTAEQAVALARQAPSMVGADYVAEVTADRTYDWDPDDTASRRWVVAAGPGPALPPRQHRIVAYDFGIKRNILRRLRQHGFAVTVVPAATPARQVLAMEPEGVFLSNGPGDPAALGYARDNVAAIIGKVPLFGICLGHQILGLALGGRTFKLKFGHHGGNQPVQDLRSGAVAITAQNHGFALDPESLPAAVEVTHINLNDRTVEGVRHRQLPVFGVQYHPEAAPGPHDAGYFFAEFAKLIAGVGRA